MLDVLVLSETDVRRLLPMEECMEVMTHVLQALARGEADMPLRSILWLPGEAGTALGYMPSTWQGEQVFGAKVTAVYPANTTTRYHSHQGVVLLFESEHGRLLAVVDCGEVTALRTAAVSGVATRVLAREDADDLAILGAGAQAAIHLDVMARVRPLRRVRVWNRTARRAQSLAEWARIALPHLAPTVEVSPTIEAALDGADLVCGTTASIDPIIEGDWIAPGAHINAVGFCGPLGGEMATSVLLRSRLVIDRWESQLNEAGEFLRAKAEGALDDSHVAGELGEVLLGTVEGRRSADEITLFRSLGLGVEDLAAARAIYLKALELDVGVLVPFAGMRGDVVTGH